jgi:hypothetical protein
VSVSGDAYCPLLAAHRSNAARIFEKGGRENTDLKLEIRQTPYGEPQIFNAHIKDVFLQTIAANRELSGCANTPALLFCDNYISHCSQEVLREMARNGVLLLTYPRHTDHILQVFDVLLFAQLKTLKKYLPKDNDEDSDADHVLRIFSASKGVTTSMMVAK